MHPAPHPSIFPLDTNFYHHGQHLAPRIHLHWNPSENYNYQQGCRAGGGRPRLAEILDMLEAVDTMCRNAATDTLELLASTIITISWCRRLPAGHTGYTLSSYGRKKQVPRIAGLKSVVMIAPLILAATRCEYDEYCYRDWEIRGR